MIDLKRKIYQPRFSKPSEKSLVLFQPSVVTELLSDSQTEFVGGKPRKLRNVRRDTAILLNQIRIDNLSIDALKKYFTENNSDMLRDLREKCSDEQLLQLCKSRYIQRPSEIDGYFDYLSHNYDAEVKRLVELQNSISADRSDGVGSDQNNNEGV